MERGIILKRFGGFFYVYSNGKVYECVCRGKNRLLYDDIYPGDLVEFIPGEEKSIDKGVIEKLLPRSNLLIRPAVANVSQVICVVALKYPNPNLFLLDRLLVNAEYYSLKAVISLNKKDLASEEMINEIINIYQNLGYKVLITSAKTGEGIDELKNELKDNLTVFAGQSGVGKSSLLNAIVPGLKSKVGEVSKKLKTGRHTTKHVEIIKLPQGGFVADTPGFSRLDLPEMYPEELGDCFPEIRKFKADCKFTSCLHNNEPECSVKAALEQGLINEHRYDNYLKLLEEVMERERCR
ncbi:MAG TPA: ribosome small subunit-dependent GTPase A [Peptococcaceae bacterium]|nr:MAG: Putative ribosome biogenesis GTPase RsgA [Clostridia bacterium 41_269]HBT20049.1 ribosome small subunit-dependent GTPase A [Peptococcaceae bacterium]